ncbi:phospholipase D-like domain-containing protein [Flavobacterium aestivum]|uniref:phospholipase D-like domain-containing protein n=1 Tax=Flavobacterium aestivum TaxID=3003257 RepID=UPI00228573E8|nr:phospholipase D-like domain-containing protein [Flavobacterium aestivum]
MNTESINTIESLSLVHSGEDYFSRLEHIITDSKVEIHIQMYILDEDEIGNKIIAALKEAALRNVKIYIVLDAFGSFSFSSKTIEELREIGINIRFFSPMFSANSIYIGRRLHNKVIVSDAKTALIGGINIANKYKGAEIELPWLDFAVELKGDLAALQNFSRAVYFKKERKKMPKVLIPKGGYVAFLQNDWLKRKNEIAAAYIKSIQNAEKEIIIVGSYFLPGRKIVKALEIASKNKVQIKLILSGISDVSLVRRATCYLYAKLLRYNMELYEWNQSVLHGKAMVIDGKWTTIGSFNLNNLSSYASIELNVEIFSGKFSREFQSQLNNIISQSQKITPETLKLKDSLFSKLINWLSYRLSRTIEIIITYLPYHRFDSL